MLPMVIYTLHVVPWIFKFPAYGSIVDELLFVVPYLLAVSVFGLSLSVFVTERESSFLVIVFTSVIFLFLSGLTWPRYAAKRALAAHRCLCAGNVGSSGICPYQQRQCFAGPPVGLIYQPVDSDRRILRGGQHNLPLPSAETAGLIPSEAAPAAFLRSLMSFPCR